jgi:hypothetical protein
MVWTFRVRSNTEVLSGASLWWGRHWVVLGWIVPIANLYVPYQVLREIWDRGFPPAVTRRPRLVTVWWITYLVAGWGPLLLLRGSRETPWLALGLAALAVVAAGLRIVVIRRLTTLQDRYLPFRPDARAVLASDG